MFRRICTFIIIFLISNLSYSDDNNQLLLHEKTKKISEFTLIDIEGKEHLISKKTSKLLLINFWATRCPPCIKEIPDLLNLKKKYDDQIEIFFISVDSNASKKVPKFLKKNDLSEIKAYKDEKLKITDKFKVNVMPTTLIINEGLEEVSRVEVFVDWLNEENISFIEKLL